MKPARAAFAFSSALILTACSPIKPYVPPTDPQGSATLKVSVDKNVNFGLWAARDITAMTYEDAPDCKQPRQIFKFDDDKRETIIPIPTDKEFPLNFQFYGYGGDCAFVIGFKPQSGKTYKALFLHAAPSFWGQLAAVLAGGPNGSGCGATITDITDASHSTRVPFFVESAFVYVCRPETRKDFDSSGKVIDSPAAEPGKP